MTATKIQWRVQVRKSRAHKWVNKGLFETRQSARSEARFLREGLYWDASKAPGSPMVGSGNTRVVRYVKGAA